MFEAERADGTDIDGHGLVATCRAAAAVDERGCCDDELLDLARSFEAARAAIDAGEAKVLAELDVRGTTDRRFGHTTSSWLAAECRLDRRVAARRVKDCRRLRQLPQSAEALAAGELSAEHVRVLGDAVANPRVGAQIVECETELIADAKTTGFRRWAAQVARVVQLLDQDGVEPDADRDLARNRVHLTDRGDGTIALTGQWVGEHALILRQALQTETDRLWRRARDDRDRTRDTPLPSRATLTALAMSTLASRGIAGGSSGNGPAVDITLVVDHTGPTATLSTVDGDPVAPAAVSHLLCDPIIHPLVVDPDTGDPLHMGRAIRYANWPQRRALARRDGGCTFPGCDVPVSWCDAHHVIWWERHGTTDIENLALLCRYHHGIVHRHGWTMTPNADQTFTITTPTGDQLHSQRHGHPPSQPAA